MKQNFLIIAVLLLAACNSPKQNDRSATKDSSAANVVQPADTSTTVVTTATVLAKHNMDFAYGIDISKYQGDEIEFIQKKGDTLSFIICKATEGIGSPDAKFKNNWTTIPKKGFIRGAYHFYHCNDDPIRQATHFVSTVDSFHAQDFPPIVDFEETSISASCATSTIQSNLLKFLKEVERQTGRKPMIYTDHNTGQKYLTSTDLANYPLFIADYNKRTSPALPGAWKNKDWALWQKSEKYIVHSTTDDFDIFNGSLEEMKSFISRH